MTSGLSVSTQAGDSGKQMSSNFRNCLHLLGIKYTGANLVARAIKLVLMK